VKVRVGDTWMVEYTGRAFNQDAQEAMSGDIVRGLIELITNADDAYAEGAVSEVGKISISVDRSRGADWSVVVRDRAIGMSATELVEKITRLGGRTSGFERGESRRGNLGRGAKDVAAFGEVTFESIRDHRYARLLLRQDGNSTLEADERATASHRETMGVPRGNGTSVTIRARAGVRCPRRDTLKTRLSGHYQLRDVLSDPARRVDLHMVNSSTTDSLIYHYPAVAATPTFEADLAIEGYPEAKAHLRIWRLPDRCDEGPESATRPSGVLIKGKRAIYDNTLFGFENKPSAGWFGGKLECAFIDELARQHDDRLAAGAPLDPRNNVPIISRRRDGLVPNHPFARALKAAAEAPLGRLIAEEEARARDEAHIEDDRARLALDRLARELGQLINDELREIEAEDVTGPGSGIVPPIRLVPESAYAYLGEDRTLSAIVRADIAAPGDSVEVTADPEGVVEILDTGPRLAAHPRNPDLLITQVRLRPIDASSTIISASGAGHTAEAIVEVRESRPIERIEIEPPETLEFEQPTYRVGLNREKSVVIRAPAQLVASVGATAVVSSSHDGVAVRTPTVELKLDEEFEFYRGVARVEGRTLGASATVRASLSEISTTTRVVVTQKEEGVRYKIKLVDEDMNPYRAVSDVVTDETTGEQLRLLKVWVRHPSLRPVLDTDGVHSRAARLVIAEAVADVAARLVVRELYRKRRGLEEFTADRLYLEHYRRVTRFLPRTQQSLLADLEQPSGMLDMGELG